MAKSFKSMLNEKISTLTDEEFFLSPVFSQHLNTIIEGVSGRYHKARVCAKITNDGNKYIAYTDNQTIVVNIGHDWIKNLPDRVSKYYVIVGIVLHECGHVLYTDFDLMKKSCEKLANNVIFPAVDISWETQKALDNNWGKKLVPVYKQFDNSVEDGHIEKRVIRAVPGYGECLMEVRDIQRMEDTPTYEEILAEGKPFDKIGTLHNLILFYAKYGINKIGNIEEEDDLTKAFSDAKGFIDTAVATNSCINRKMEVNKMFDRLVAFIVDEIKKRLEEKKKSKSKSSEESETSSSASGESSESAGEGSEEEESKGSSSKESESEEEKSESGSEEDTKSEESSESSSSEEEGEEETSSSSKEGDDSEESDESEEISDEEIEKELEEIMKKLSEESPEEEMTERRSSGRPIGDNTEDESEDSEGSEEDGKKVSKPEAAEGDDEIDLSYLEKEIAEDYLAKELHGKIEKDMAKTSDRTRKNRTDKCPSIERYIEPDAEAEDDFNNKHQELDRIARRVVKNLDKIIKERQIGDVAKGLYVGKMLDSKHAYRKDHRIMANKILPEDVPDMEVCVLVDCSGSMSYSDRMPRSVECAYITYKFCRIMGIPVSVYGHTTDGGHSESTERVLMQCVAHKDCVDSEDEKRIFMLRAHRNNRDGFALQFCAETLVNSPASNKLLFIISDGLPAAYGYSSSAGKKDLREVIRNYKRKGISFVTAGIDECAEDIHDVYTKGVPVKEAAKFLDFSDMNGLPRAFASILKKELL